MHEPTVTKEALETSNMEFVVLLAPCSCGGGGGVCVYSCVSQGSSACWPAGLLLGSVDRF